MKVRKSREEQRVISSFKLITEQRVGRIIRRQTLLRATNQRRLGRAMIGYVLNRHDTKEYESVEALFSVKRRKISVRFYKIKRVNKTVKNY